MAGTVLDGKVLAQQIEKTLSARVQRLQDLSHGVTPTLATILVGSDPASATYVRMKRNACKRIGMGSARLELAQETTTEELLAHIERLNGDPAVHGILLQHPVPSHIDERRCFDAICIDKDVDGVTCHGFGRMAMGAEAYGSATPAGIMRLLEHYNVPIVGKHAVVVGQKSDPGQAPGHAAAECARHCDDLPLAHTTSPGAGATGRDCRRCCRETRVYQRCVDC